MINYEIICMTQFLYPRYRSTMRSIKIKKFIKQNLGKRLSKKKLDDFASLMEHEARKAAEYRRSYDLRSHSDKLTKNQQ